MTTQPPKEIESPSFIHASQKRYSSFLKYTGKMSYSEKRSNIDYEPLNDIDL